MHRVGRVAFYAVTRIMVCNPCVSQHLRCAAGLVAAVVVAVAPVRLLLLQLFSRPVLLAVAVAVVLLRRGPLAVVPVSLALVTRPHPVLERHPRLGVVQALEVVAAAAGVGGGALALRHHLQVGPDAVVAGAGVVAEVDDAALVGALVGGFDPREAELVGDVAPHDFHHLPGRDGREGVNT